MYRSKEKLLGSFILLVFFVLLIINKPIQGDRLLPDNGNYFEIERSYFDTVSETTITDTIKFFPFGWWYHPSLDPTMTNFAQIDSMYTDAIDPVIGDTNKYNVIMPTYGGHDSVLTRHLKTGIRKGMYAFGVYPRFIYGLLHFIERFRDIHPDYTKEYNDSVLCSYGWYEFCDSCNTILSSDIEILSPTRKEQKNEIINDTFLIGSCLHVVSASTDFSITWFPDNIDTNVVDKNWHLFKKVYRISKYKPNWLSFKIASDTTFRDTLSPLTFRFIAKYSCHNSLGDTTEIYVELNSRHWTEIDTVGYHNDTITVSLQNTEYFSDVEDDTIPVFPLYDRNPSYKIDLVADSSWFIVFAMMDSIIYNYTGGEWFLDSLRWFKLIGTHYYIDLFSFSRNLDDIQIDAKQSNLGFKGGRNIK